MANLAELLQMQQDEGAAAVVGALTYFNLMRWDPERMAYVFSEGQLSEEMLYDEINRRLGRHR